MGRGEGGAGHWEHTLGCADESSGETWEVERRKGTRIILIAFIELVFSLLWLASLSQRHSVFPCLCPPVTSTLCLAPASVQAAQLERERDEAVARLESAQRKAERAARDAHMERQAYEVGCRGVGGGVRMQRGLPAGRAGPAGAAPGALNTTWPTGRRAVPLPLQVALKHSSASRHD